MTSGSECLDVDGVDVDAARAATPGCLRAAFLLSAGSSLPTTATLDAVIGHLRLESDIGGYAAADRVHEVLERGRDDLAALVGGLPDEIALQPSDSVAWVKAWLGWVFGGSVAAGSVVLVDRLVYHSHYAVLDQTRAIAGFSIGVLASLPDGTVDLEQMEISDKVAGDLGVTDLDHDRVDQHHRVDPVERSVLPGEHLTDDRVGDLRDLLSGDLGRVDLLQMGLDVAGRHPLRVQRDDLRGEAVEPAGMLRDGHRFERRGPIAGHLHLDRADISDHRLRARPVARVPRASAFRRVRFITEMLFPLGVQPGLQDLRDQRRQQPAVTGQTDPVTPSSFDQLTGDPRQRRLITRQRCRQPRPPLGAAFLVTRERDAKTELASRGVAVARIAGHGVNVAPSSLVAEHYMHDLDVGIGRSRPAITTSHFPRPNIGRTAFVATIRMRERIRP